MDDPGVTGIMSEWNRQYICRAEGRIRRYEAGFESKEKLEDVIQQIVADVMHWSIERLRS